MPVFSVAALCSIIRASSCDRLCSPQNLAYFISGPLQKKRWLTLDLGYVENGQEIYQEN